MRRTIIGLVLSLVILVCWSIVGINRAITGTFVDVYARWCNYDGIPLYVH